MSTIFQVNKLFTAKTSLKNLQQRVQSGLKSQEEALHKLNEQQDLCRVYELNWEHLTCYCFLLEPKHTLACVKNTLKCLLIERYGEKAVHLKIIIKDNNIVS